MDEFVVYILYSSKHDKKYYGQTSNLIARFKDHNELGKKGWVMKFRPWEVVHLEFFDNKAGALEKEKFFKTGRGREWIKNNIFKYKL